jgi:hypothetical protein
VAVFFRRHKKAPRDLHLRGAVLVGEHHRSLVIPFMAQISGQKTGKDNNSQYGHKYVHISQHIYSSLLRISIEIPLVN